MLFSSLKVWVWGIFQNTGPFSIPVIQGRKTTFGVTSPGNSGKGGGRYKKMAFLRCKRDPCGVICLILTYFSVFYADYVVIQYVLIPAYSDRYVFIFLIWLDLYKRTWSLLYCAVFIQLAAGRFDNILFTDGPPHSPSYLLFLFFCAQASM